MGGLPPAWLRRQVRVLRKGGAGGSEAPGGELGAWEEAHHLSQRPQDGHQRVSQHQRLYHSADGGGSRGGRRGVGSRGRERLQRSFNRQNQLAVSAVEHGVLRFWDSLFKFL